MRKIANIIHKSKTNTTSSSTNNSAFQIFPFLLLGLFKACQLGQAWNKTLGSLEWQQYRDSPVRCQTYDLSHEHRLREEANVAIVSSHSPLESPQPPLDITWLSEALRLPFLSYLSICGWPGSYLSSDLGVCNLTEVLGQEPVLGLQK